MLLIELEELLVELLLELLVGAGKLDVDTKLVDVVGIEYPGATIVIEFVSMSIRSEFPARGTQSKATIMNNLFINPLWTNHLRQRAPAVV